MTQKLNTDKGLLGRCTRTTGYNSTCPKGEVSCSKDSLVFNQTLVFQIKFCGKSPALRVAAKRYMRFLLNGLLRLTFTFLPTEYEMLENGV
ncbi:MAG: hypothetical protein IPP32_14310 [Bacteroidetes bacterium]|nr:hypothetical protein [Bacteroidota bacterium]